jgi:hypothetical protein
MNAVGVHIADAVRVQGGLVRQSGFGHSGPEDREHEVVVLADRILRKPVDAVGGPIERAPVDQHLECVLVDPDLGGLLSGHEAVLCGRDVPQLVTREGLPGHGRSITEP